MKINVDGKSGLIIGLAAAGAGAVIYGISKIVEVIKKEKPAEEEKPEEKDEPVFEEVTKEK